MIYQIAMLGCIILLVTALIVIGSKPRQFRRQRRLAHISRDGDISPEQHTAQQDQLREREAAILAEPRLRRALTEGRVIDATRHVRKAGFTVSEARNLVERYASR